MNAIRPVVKHASGLVLILAKGVVSLTVAEDVEMDVLAPVPSHVQAQPMLFIVVVTVIEFVLIIVRTSAKNRVLEDVKLLVLHHVRVIAKMNAPVVQVDVQVDVIIAQLVAWVMHVFRGAKQVVWHLAKVDVEEVVKGGWLSK